MITGFAATEPLKGIKSHLPGTAGVPACPRPAQP